MEPASGLGVAATSMLASRQVTVVQLAPSAYAGASHPTPRRLDAFVGQSYFDGFVAVTAWARDDVRRLLPPELELASPVSGQSALHAVIFVFGTPTDCVMRFAGLPIPACPDYHELGVAVPFVVRRADHALHLYIARMYASYPPAVWAGNTYYGFSKELADVQRGADRFCVAGFGGQSVFEASTTTSDVDATGEFEPVRALFMLPVLGRRRDGSVVCSHFDWDVRGVPVRSARAQLLLDGACAGGVTGQRWQLVPDETFAFTGMRWRLSWPGQCAGVRSMTMRATPERD